MSKRSLVVIGDTEQPDPDLEKVCRQIDPAWLYQDCRNYRPECQTPDRLLVALGKKAAETLLARPVKLDDVLGQTVEVPIPGRTDAVTVFVQYHPGYITKMLSIKGGASEKALNAWLDMWDSVQEVLAGGEAPIPEVECVTDIGRLRELLQAVASLPADSPVTVAFDYETWGDRDARRPDLCSEFKILTIGVSLRETFGAGEVGAPAGVEEVAFAFPFEWNDRQVWSDDEFEEIRGLWLDCLETRRMAAHYAKYEHKCNIKVFGHTWPAACTMLRDDAINELFDHKLHRVAARCGVPWTRYKAQSDEIRQRPGEAELGALLRYNALDALATAIAYDRLTEQLRAEGDLVQVAEMQEEICVGLAELEMTGMAADTAAAVVQRAEIEARLPVLDLEFRAMPEVQRVERWATKTMKSHSKGAVFSARSSPMMRQLLIKELKLPIKPTRKKNSKNEYVETYKLDKRALEPYEKQFPVLDRLQELRSLSAMKTGFLDKWEAYVGPDGCIHSQYHQAKVVTGRLSSTDPPQQNIPGDSPIRRVYCSRFPGGSLVNGDFVQQEPRVLAGWAQDRKMIAAIMDGLDLHGFVASEIFHVPYLGRDTEKRDIGKRMNLGIMYGQTEHGLSAKTGISVEEALALLKAYDHRFDGIAGWRAGKHREASTLGYVTDFFGGRRHLEGARSPDRWERERALRQAGNYPIQRTSAWFTLLSLRQAQLRVQELGLQGEIKVCSTVHDSLVADAAPGHAERCVEILREAMTYHNDQYYWRDRDCPMDVEFKVGPNLFDMRKVP